MLQAYIRLADVTSPASQMGRDLFFGLSYIKPFPHNLLNTEISSNKDGFQLLVHERSALLDQNLIDQWKRNASFYELQVDLDRAGIDYLLIRVIASLRSVQIRASHLGTAPVYLTVRDGAIWIDWSVNEIVKRSNGALDLSRVAVYLSRNNDYGTKTLFRDVYRVAAGTTFDVSEAGVQITNPELPDLLTVGSLAEGADPRKLLFRGMSAVYRSRFLDPKTTAAEISGGMDSAIAALSLSDALGSGLRSSGAIFAGEMGEAQQSRRRLIIDRGLFEDSPITAEAFPPYMPNSPRRTPPGVWPADENYPELFDHALGYLSSLGIDTLISGLGGDEVYPRYAAELGRSPRQKRELSPLLTSRVGELYAQRGPAFSNIRLLESSWISAAGRAERALRHGIWPIYPYLTPQITYFTFRLPYEYRNDRMLHRSTLTWLLGNDVFETDYVKETFFPLYVKGVIDNREYLVGLFRDSLLADLGLIYPDLVVDAIDNAINRDKSLNDDLFFIINLELYLRGASVSDRNT